MKYLLIACTCLIAGFFSYTLPQTNFYPEGDDPWFYAANSVGSTLIVYIVLSIQRSTLTYLITLIETCAVIVNFVTVLSGLTTDRFFYMNYDTMLDALFVIECLVLAYWMPWNGIRNGLNKYFALNFNGFEPSFNRIISTTQETEKC